MEPGPKLPGAVLLTGGKSRRMGFDKALLSVGGVPNSVRMARLLLGVASPVIEVGPGHSGLAFVTEEPPGAGPLVALCAGAQALARQGHRGAILAVACDMPHLNAAVLEALAAWPSDRSVVPLAIGRLQPLCARWSVHDQAVAAELVARGERSLRALLDEAQFDEFSSSRWPPGVADATFSDTDTPADLRALGLSAEVTLKGNP